MEDKPQRQKALVAYAQALKINVLKAKKFNGEYNEDYLAVLIHDEEQVKKTRRFQNVGIIVGALFLMAVVIVAIFLFVNMAAVF